MCFPHLFRRSKYQLLWYVIHTLNTTIQAHPLNLPKNDVILHRKLPIESFQVIYIKSANIKTN